MCSTIRVLNRINLHLAAGSQSYNLTKSSEDDFAEWCVTLSFVARLVAYVAILVLLVIVIFMLMKYFEGFDEERTGEEAGDQSTETNPLWRGKTLQFSYGTCEEDLESGIRNDNDVGSCSHSSSQEEDHLYDKKVCVICYDEQRSCFFVPCGHCATCYVCAQRIFNGENKTCPVCRRLIGKVRKLFAS
ncbi:E3 ubiquitin-protein ligase APD2-like isoform X2 [Juglans regia]|uniref:E3 ubiquitin-protein ligase APD2-like isoform X2 n=1 Tax=Juglans regia TaxID=51240 RepID=A0A6P9EK23_JUGRE|nr:E3 ubiquitin-protein ligase APD2-like isoform X2 [Juglans regia]